MQKLHHFYSSKSLRIFSGTISDRYGRILPLCSGVAGMFIDNAAYLLVWWRKTDLSLSVLYAAAILEALCGGKRLIVGSVNSYLCDQFDSKPKVRSATKFEVNKKTSCAI